MPWSDRDSSISSYKRTVFSLQSSFKTTADLHVKHYSCMLNSLSLHKNMKDVTSAVTKYWSNINDWCECFLSDQHGLHVTTEILKDGEQRKNEEWWVPSLTLASSYLILLLLKASSLVLTQFSLSEKILPCPLLSSIAGTKQIRS